MGARELFFLIVAVVGGLALFIFGMNVMTDGLRRAAGPRLRDILARTTANRTLGITLGTVLGLLIHSSGTSVMLVGFVNAGLMTLLQSVPVVLGANVGTTLSMQAISFDLSAYTFFIISVGFIIKMGAPEPRTKQFGLAILGFGLLFLGLTLMSDAVRPHRDTLAPLLQGITSKTVPGMLTGLLLAAAITAIIQSSGATIGISFALIQAGVFTSLEQTFPLVLGAHIGTCATAMLGSIGANIQARRCAFSHLLFNLFNVILALITQRLFLWFIPLTSDDLVRQTANLHTAIMLTAALVIVPVTPWFTRTLTLLIRSRKPEPQPSYLDGPLLAYPEKALDASIRELQRVARLCSRSLMLSAETILFTHTRRTVMEIKRTEQAVNEVKISMKSYLTELTRRELSKRQAILIQHINRCMIDLERIGDHIDAICDVSLRRRKEPETTVDGESLDRLFDLYAKALKTFRAVIASLDPDNQDIQQMAERVLRLRDEYIEQSIDTKSSFTDKVAQNTISPIAAFYFNEYIAGLDRIVKHSKSIALAERQPQFWIKRNKLDRQAIRASQIPRPTNVEAHDYLDRLQQEDYL